MTTKEIDEINKSVFAVLFPEKCQHLNIRTCIPNAEQRNELGKTSIEVCRDCHRTLPSCPDFCGSWDAFGLAVERLEAMGIEALLCTPSAKILSSKAQLWKWNPSPDSRCNELVAEATADTLPMALALAIGKMGEEK